MVPYRPAPLPSLTLSYQTGVLFVLLSGVCWSSMGLGIRLIESANVWQILFWRSAAIVPFLFVIIALQSGGKPMAVIRRSGIAAVIGGACLVVAFTGAIYAMQTTSIANAVFMFAAAPLFAALLGRLILGEPVRRATWWAMVVAIGGIGLMVGEGIALGNALGNAAAGATALAFACFTVAIRWRKLNDMMPAVFLAGLFATGVAGIICLADGGGLVVSLNDLVISLAMGVFQVGAGLVLYTLGSRSVPAAELALLSMTEVLLSPLWVWILLGETVGIYTLAGGAVLMLAITGNALSGIRRKPVPTV
ncbi:MAG: DMT family transporter [Proteobacteria bacterium]|nr:DMT family transporter [Pseudomonadota bacterium]